MAKYVKKKFNVLVFILLLFCAFVPGVIYAIYCAIPARVQTEKPKTTGWPIALVGSLINVGLWVYWVVYLTITEGKNDVPVMFYLNLGFTALLFVLVLLNRNGKSVFLTFSSIFFVVITSLVSVFYLFYGWVGIIASILCLVGLIKMQKYHKYVVYGIKELDEEVEEIE